MNPEHPWVELAKELGAEVYPSWPGNKVPIVQWRVADALITAEGVQGGGLAPFTRVHTVYVGDGGFEFDLGSSSVSTELGKLLLFTQDLLVGDKSFDRRFVVRGSDKARTRALFGRPRVLELLKGHWNMRLQARPMSRGQGEYSRGDVDGLAEVVFRNSGILSTDRLRRVFELFHEILDEFGVTATGDDHDVKVLIARLRAPGGTLHGFRLIWDGDIRRREAAKLLGELGDPQAVEALMDVLSDPDDALRLAAVEALGLIGDRRAVAPLSSLLADRGRVEAGVISERVAQALERLGAEDFVEAFHLALQGRDAALRRCVRAYRARTPVAHALIQVIEGSDLSAVEAAARTLGRLGVREVLPELRRIQRKTGWDRSREACRRAIAAVESMDSLPRPADPERGSGDTLPRPAGEQGSDATTLPRAVGEDGEDGDDA